MNKPTNILIILDGWGVAPKSKGNAIELARKPFFDSLKEKYPYTTLNATGLAAGLSENERSGSEAGHLNIGAGRIIKQDSQIINESIESGDFFKNPRLRRTINYAKIHHSSLHLMGLLSNSDSPHSDPKHLSALLKMAKNNKVKNVFLHLFTDGRDAFPYQSLEFLEKLNKEIEKVGLGKIASVTGRYYAMDRVKHWKRLEKAYEAIVLGKGEKARSAREAIQKSHRKKISDEFILPTVIVDKNNQPIGQVKDHDALIFFNLRGDRGRQLTKLFTLDNIIGYEDRERELKKIFMATLTDFGPDLPVQVAYPSREIENTLPYVMRDFKQLYISEAEKYPHITYFFNGGYKDPIGGEDRIRISSPEVSSYDQKPEMSAGEVTKVITDNIEHQIYDFIAVNYANTDMVGHTGNLKAAISAVETIDKCLKQVVTKILNSNGLAIITADHGNADEMIDPRTGQVSTMHSKNPVPFMIVKNGLNKKNCLLRGGGILGDVAPTLLDLIGVSKPKEMTERSLIEK